MHLCIHLPTFMESVCPLNCNFFDLPQCTQSSVSIYLLEGDFWQEKCRLLLLGMFSKAPVGTSYRVLEHVKGDHTHSSAVFKAQVVSRENARGVPEVPGWFVVLH